MQKVHIAVPKVHSAMKTIIEIIKYIENGAAHKHL